MSAWTCRQLSARPPLRSFHLVFEPHDGSALAPIPKRSTSPRVTSAPPVVDSLKALDPNRPIREADMSGSGLLPCKLTPEPHFASRKSLLPASRVGFGGVSD